MTHVVVCTAGQMKHFILDVCKVTFKPEMELYLTRCEDKQQEYTCRFYMKKTVKDICPHIPEKEKIWSDLVQHMVGLKPACPIKPGSFVLKDAPIDTNEVKDLPIQYGFWKIRAVGKQNGKVTNCHLIEFYLLKKKGKTSIF
ncbi:uncharacterized protein [Anabrus simplex]|uniref:uncharacterized protein n=1 Tax=Anabrus simplex TaxID=316456 RepID=UPI0035A3A67C